MVAYGGQVFGALLEVGVESLISEGFSDLDVASGDHLVGERSWPLEVLVHEHLEVVDILLVFLTILI